MVSKKHEMFEVRLQGLSNTNLKPKFNLHFIATSLPKREKQNERSTVFGYEREV
jgi:hypothetical protein